MDGSHARLCLLINADVCTSVAGRPPGLKRGRWDYQGELISEKKPVNQELGEEGYLLDRFPTAVSPTGQCPRSGSCHPQAEKAGEQFYAGLPQLSSHIMTLPGSNFQLSPGCTNLLASKSLYFPLKEVNIMREGGLLQGYSV